MLLRRRGAPVRISPRHQHPAHFCQRVHLPAGVGDGAGHGLGLLVLAGLGAAPRPPRPDRRGPPSARAVATRAASTLRPSSDVKRARPDRCDALTARAGVDDGLGPHGRPRRQVDLDADTRSDMITWTPTPRRGKDKTVSVPVDDIDDCRRRWLELRVGRFTRTDGGGVVRIKSAFRRTGSVRASATVSDSGLLPSPGLRWGSARLTPKQVVGSLVGPVDADKVEHSRVSGPVGQGADRVAGPGLVEFPQQVADLAGVVEADLGGGPVGQGADRVAGPGRAQLPQQVADGPQFDERPLFLPAS